MPSEMAQLEKMGRTEERPQSAAEGATTPSSRVSGELKILHAYTLPTDSVPRSEIGTLS